MYANRRFGIFDSLVASTLIYLAGALSVPLAAGSVAPTPAGIEQTQPSNVIDRLNKGDRLRIRSVEPQIELAELTAVIARA